MIYARRLPEKKRKRESRGKKSASMMRDKNFKRISKRFDMHHDLFWQVNPSRLSTLKLLSSKLQYYPWYGNFFSSFKRTSNNSEHFESRITEDYYYYNREDGLSRKFERNNSISNKYFGKILVR